MREPAQEEAVDEKIQEIKQELHIDGKSDYDKICAIYDYICANVEYDYENLKTDDRLKYSTYAALFRNKSVCQGYATLFYRLALEYDIDCRIIAGISNGESHSWNIVKLDDKYYLCDATWDAGSYYYYYFLKGLDDFYNHTPFDYIEDITSNYPISNTDYEVRYNEENPAYDSEEYKAGDFTYVLNSLGRAMITSYNGQAKNVTIPATINNHPVYDVGYGAFDGNQKVENIVISEGIVSISNCGGCCPFIDCSNLKTITIPSTLKLIASNTTNGLGIELVANCSKLEQFIVSPDNKYLCSDNGILFNKKKDVLIKYPSGKQDKKYVVPQNVEALGFASFEYQGYIEEVVIPDHIKAINYFTFDFARNLKKVNIPSQCEVIGQRAFTGTSIEELYIPEKVDIIIGPTFNTTELRKITVSKDNKWFYDVDGVLYRSYSDTDKKGLLCYPAKHQGTSFAVPDDVIIIDDYTFAYASLLQNISLPNDISYIGSNAFYRCTDIDSVVIPSEIITIEDGTFWDCESLRYVVVPDSVENIQEYAFCNISPVIVGETGSYAQTYARENAMSFWNINDESKSGSYNGFTWKVSLDGLFELNGSGAISASKVPWENYLSMIKTIKISNGITKLDVKFSKSLVKKIEFPNSLVEIGNECFFDCDVLKKVKIPSSVKKIGDYAFYGSARLEEVNIPDSIVTIGENVFAWCENLTNVEMSNAEMHKLILNHNYVYQRMFSETPWYKNVGSKHDLSIFTTKIINKKSATCTSKGYTGDKVCSICKYVISKGKAIDTKPHSYTSYKVVTAPTSSREGVKVKTCTVCKKM